MTAVKLLLPWVAVLPLAAAVAASALGEPARPTLAQANAALQAGEADKAREVLRAAMSNGADPAEASNLECRVEFTLEHWSVAADACQKAVNMEDGNSNYHMWLGRALGGKASQASFLTAFGLGRRVRVEFEAAVNLNPKNAEALADLGEFYRSAPGVVGGGLSKASEVAAQLDHVDAARAHELRGRIAEERGDFVAAEREYKQAIAASPHPAFRWTTLASFYKRRGRWQELDAAIQSCIGAVEHDRSAGVPLFDGASTLIEANRDLPRAAKMLEEYLASGARTEEAPAFVAYTRLARTRMRLGDEAGAMRAQTAALSLAHDYRPAQDLKVQETRR